MAFIGCIGQGYILVSLKARHTQNRKKLQAGNSEKLLLPAVSKQFCFIPISLFLNFEFQEFHFFGFPEI